MPLTDIQCRNAKPREKAYKLADQHRLYLQVSPTGSKYWRANYKFDGKEKTMALGVYPAVSLVAARKAWNEAQALLHAGKDPMAERKNADLVRAESGAITFEKVARDWWNLHKDSWAPMTREQNIRRLEADIFKAIGHIPIAQVKSPQILEALRKIEARGSLDVAGRVRANIVRVFNYAMSCGYRDDNPAIAVAEAMKTHKAGHFAAIDVEELPAFLKVLATNEACMNIKTRTAMNVLMHTFVRTTELIAAPWSEFDLDGAMWIIPADRMKMKRDHMVPLSRQVVGLLRELQRYTGKNPAGYLFPNDHDPKRPMSDGAILVALKRMGYKNTMTGHGFRSLAFGAITQELGFDDKLADLQLAHVKKDKVKAAYDRAKWLEERKRMMQAWSDYLDSITRKALIGMAA